MGNKLLHYRSTTIAASVKLLTIKEFSNGIISQSKKELGQPKSHAVDEKKLQNTKESVQQRSEDVHESPRHLH
jgi:hypothetical protein